MTMDHPFIDPERTDTSTKKPAAGADFDNGHPLIDPERTDT